IVISCFGRWPGNKRTALRYLFHDIVIGKAGKGFSDTGPACPENSCQPPFSQLGAGTQPVLQNRNIDFLVYFFSRMAFSSGSRAFLGHFEKTWSGTIGGSADYINPRTLVAQLSTLVFTIICKSVGMQ